MELAQKLYTDLDVSSLTQFQQDTVEITVITFVVANVALFLSIVK